MSFARVISRGAFLKARLGVNGIQNASRSFGRASAARRAWDIWNLRGQTLAYPATRRLPTADYATHIRAPRASGVAARRAVVLSPRYATTRGFNDGSRRWRRRT